MSKLILCGWSNIFQSDYTKKVGALMQIKTITTAAGVNEIDFGNDDSRITAHFYWFKNLSDSILYVSAKPNPVAGADNVAELPAKGAASVETDEGKVYVLGAGKVEIHRTNSKFCPFELPSTGSGGGGTVDAYTKTESDAKYAQKTDIPSSLPANGGNADTVDGYHVDNLIHASESIPPEYITEFLRINDDTKSIERWSTNNLRVEFANNAAKAENADTVGGLHANDFTKIIDFGYTAIDTKTAIGQLGKTTIYRCATWTDYPAEFIDSQGTLIAVNYNSSGTDLIWCTQIIVNPRPGNKMFIRYMDGTSVSDWKEISTTPIKSTTFSGTTNEYGNVVFAAVGNKIPVFAECSPYCGIPLRFNDNYWIRCIDPITNSNPIAANTAVTGTVYYVEI